MRGRATAQSASTHAGGQRPAAASRIERERAEAERMAWTALGRYKFVLFGYWCGIWVHLNRIADTQLPNPWTGLVGFSEEVEHRFRRKLNTGFGRS